MNSAAQWRFRHETGAARSSLPRRDPWRQASRPAGRFLCSGAADKGACRGVVALACSLGRGIGPPERDILGFVTSTLLVERLRIARLRFLCFIRSLSFLVAMASNATALHKGIVCASTRASIVLHCPGNGLPSSRMTRSTGFPSSTAELPLMTSKMCLSQPVTYGCQRPELVVSAFVATSASHYADITSRPEVTTLTIITLWPPSLLDSA